MPGYIGRAMTGCIIMPCGCIIPGCIMPGCIIPGCTMPACIMPGCTIPGCIMPPVGVGAALELGSSAMDCGWTGDTFGTGAAPSSLFQCCVLHVTTIELDSSRGE